MRIQPLRLGLALAGVALAAYGVLRLLELGVSNLWATLVWLAGGVIAHDALLAPVIVVVGVAAAWLVPDRWRGAVAVGFVVLGTVTIVAVPVLGRFGVRPDNPTLLDRPYWTGWWLFATLVVVGVLVRIMFLRRRPHRRNEVGREAEGVDGSRRR